MRNLLMTTMFVLMSIIGIQAQAKDVSGTIIGEDGQPIPGVSIIIKGTTIGTVTDFDGRYTLKVDEGQTLLFKFIGLQEQEREIGSENTYDVTLSDDTKLVEEVMVVAYGTAKKSAFTGSATQVKADKIAERSVSNAMQALSGSVAGVQITNSSGQPGSEPTIRIRGIGTMNASAKPLYVVDGVPYDGNIAAINPQDIESMSVLKDAASSAIYGARGANGVVLITTKKAKGKDAIVNVEARWGNNSRAVPNYEVMTDPAMYIETYYKSLYNSRIYNGFSAEDAHKYANDNIYSLWGSESRSIYTIPGDQRLVGTNFKLNPNATLGRYDAESGYFYSPDDWYDEMFKKSNMRQEYNVSTSGNTDRLNYYMSFGYLDDTGIINNTGFTRYSARVSGDYQAKDWMKLGTNMAYTYYNRKSDSTLESWGSSGNIFYVANLMAPVYPIYLRNNDGSVMYDSNNNRRYDYNSTRAFMQGANPAGDYDLNDRNNETDNFSGKWYVNITPIENLTISATLGTNIINERANSITNPYYGPESSRYGYASVTHYRTFALNQQYLLTYKKSFADVHNIDILAGYESYHSKDQDLDAGNSRLYNPTIAEINNTVDPEPSVHSYVLKYATQGFLTRLQYDYDNKYFISGSYRRDASSCFHPDNRWGNFGSGGVAWLMSSESFIKDNISWINMLKVKASLGVQGNDNLGREDDDDAERTWAYAPYEDLYKVEFSGKKEEADDYYSISFAKKGNKDITWETSYSFNAGVDFELFKGRLSGTIEYFWRKTSDMLYNMEVPSVLGYSSIPMNIGDIVNKGFEFDITGTIFENDKISVDLNINGTSYKNEITDLADVVKETGIKSSSSIYRIGGSMYNAYIPRFAGVDHSTGKALYYVDPDNGDWNTTDNYDDANQSDLGCTMPKIYGGFGLAAEGYGFDLSTQLSFQLGGKIYDGTYEALMHTGYTSMAGTNWHKDILDAWTPENPNSNIPRICSTDASYQLTNDRFMVKSNYLCFNNAVLGYTIPSDLSKKLLIEKFRVYISCDNIALLTCRKGIDPRQRLGGGSSTTSGNYSYSAQRTISCGVQLTF